MFAEELENKGITIIRNAYSLSQINELRNKFNEEWDDIRKNKDNLIWKKRQYTDTNRDFFINKALYHNKWTSQYKDKLIVDMSDSRYDFTMNDLFIPSPIAEFIKNILHDDYSMQYGALPVINSKKAYHGYWHRDAIGLFNNEDININLPPYYITMLIPLSDVNIDDGPTEFILNSHRYNLFKLGITNAKQLQDWAKDQAKVQGILKVGDIVIFNGYLIHRGLANRSKSTRGILYIVFKKNWYTDESGRDYIELDKN